MKQPIAANDNIHPDEPDAVKYGFPHGGMTVSGLRREADRGRLAVERIANKDFTTLRAIEEMRKLRLVEAKRARARVLVWKLLQGRTTTTTNTAATPPKWPLLADGCGSTASALRTSE